MANEIRATYDTGFTLYVLVFNAAGQVWRNNAPQQFLAYAPGAIGVYDIPLSEIATNSGEYRADWPIHANMIEGIYSVVLFEQAGGGPAAADDERIGETGVMVWDGGSTEYDTLEIMDFITDTIMGPAGDDLDDISGQLDNVETSTAVTIPNYILSDVIGADSDTLETLSDQLDVVGTGSGATAETYTVTNSITGLPLDGVRVWMTSDLAGLAEVGGSGHTNAIGEVTLRHDLPTGTAIYVWRELAGYTFDDPDLETAS